MLDFLHTPRQSPGQCEKYLCTTRSIHGPTIIVNTHQSYKHIIALRMNFIVDSNCAHDKFVHLASESLSKQCKQFVVVVQSLAHVEQLLVAVDSDWQ